MIRAIRRRTRLRLTLLYVLVLSVVATAALASFWLAFLHAEYGVVDDALRVDARGLIAGLHPTNGHLAFGNRVPLPGESPDGVVITAVIVGPGMVTIDRTGGTLPVGDVANEVRDALAGKTDADTANVAGAPSRVLAEPIDLGGGQRGALVISRSVAEMEQILTEHEQLLAVIAVGLVGVASLLGYWLAGRALRPVRAIAAMAKEMGEGRLDARIELDLAPGDELGELAGTFNDMLGRLEMSFATLRRFTADAAHDLRAPLTLLRSEVEVALSRPRSGAEYQASLRTVLAETARLSRLADQLLLLARADAGALRPRGDDIDVADLVDEAVSHWETLARDRGVVVTTKIPDSGVIVGDSDMLRRLLDNLIDNAIRHTPSGGDIEVSAALLGDRWCIDVRDSGEGISAEARKVVFERFTRGDHARGRETGGAGLGLAVCAAIARLHGGSIAVIDDGPGAHLHVDLSATIDPTTADA